MQVDYIYVRGGRQGRQQENMLLSVFTTNLEILIRKFLQLRSVMQLKIISLASMLTMQD